MHRGRYWGISGSLYQSTYTLSQKAYHQAQTVESTDLANTSRSRDFVRGPCRLSDKMPVEILKAPVRPQPTPNAWARGPPNICSPSSSIEESRRDWIRDAFGRLADAECRADVVDILMEPKGCLIARHGELERHGEWAWGKHYMPIYIDRFLKEIGPSLKSPDRSLMEIFDRAIGSYSGSTMLAQQRAPMVAPLDFLILNGYTTEEAFILWCWEEAGREIMEKHEEVARKLIEIEATRASMPPEPGMPPSGFENLQENFKSLLMELEMLRLRPLPADPASHTAVIERCNYLDSWLKERGVDTEQWAVYHTMKKPYEEAVKFIKKMEEDLGHLKWLLGNLCDNLPRDQVSSPRIPYI
jgi:hypothetical protein